MIAKVWKKLKRIFGKELVGDEPLMYRVELFRDLRAKVGDRLVGKRALEIGPKDGLDSKRIAELGVGELVMIDLPEKRDGNVEWLENLQCKKWYVEGNLLYMNEEELKEIGKFDLIWCTGVLYHNAEQLRLLRKLYCLLNKEGWLVLESSTARGPRKIREGAWVQVHYPQTYRDTGTITHHPTKGAIKAWLDMAGFSEVIDSDCYRRYNSDLIGVRYGCIAKKGEEEAGDIYYAKSGLNDAYVLGEAK